MISSDAVSFHDLVPFSPFPTPLQTPINAAKRVWERTVPAFAFKNGDSATRHNVIPARVTDFTAVVAVSDRRNHVVIAGCLAVPAVLLLVVHLVFEHDSFLIAQNLFALGFLVYSTSLVLKFLFVTQRVTFDTICASVCVYFLLGVMWSIVYSVIDVVQPGSFAYGAMNDETVLQLRFGGENTASALYFSYVTLTTLGYGDIVPSTMLTRMLTSLEAMTGQIYLAVLVARLVGLHISQKTSE